MNYEIAIEWEIHDARKMYCFRTGTSTMIARRWKEEAIKEAIA